MPNNAYVDVPASGECVTRNGTYKIARMTASEEDGKVTLGFVSGRLKRSLHSGATISTQDLDAFCRAWMKAREHNLDSDVRQAVIDKLAAAKCRISEATKLLTLI